MATKAPVKKANTDNRVIEHLNVQVANWSVMYMKLHHFHWYVKGPNFFSLHVKFEELYDEATLILDELAERVLTIGGKPLSTLKEHLAQATIGEAKGGESTEQMVKAIIADFEQLSDEAGQLADLSEEAGDKSTADMLIGRQEWIQKSVWMLKAYLG
ncbi:DNA starvation/stationary phase protection protein [Paenibacillus sp. IB182496]|uniref:DNA starvation/stationary phase protection protein n=1 Tax=Paenibacillus sabuli TaxID=2772509 RepID=A0A927BUB1_9BACL|nr:Dps family protein [Paenibacillus sabuli]MBD2845885.1 DNA starvation/stationary phase protection protein [Paenibacillus sabuli]